MAQVTLSINGRPYTVACDDGQEPQLMALATDLDNRARMLGEATGVVNEGLVLVLTGLMLADELSDVKARTSGAGDEVAALQARNDELEQQFDQARDALEKAHARLQQRRDEAAARSQGEDEVAVAIETLAQRIEAIAKSFAAA